MVLMWEEYPGLCRAVETSRRTIAVVSFALSMMRDGPSEYEIVTEEKAGR
jgi:hypothetical protein